MNFRTHKYLFFVVALAFCVSLFFEHELFLLISGLLIDPFLQSFFVWITDYGVVFLFLGLLFYFLYHKKWHYILLLILSVSVTLEISFLLKKFFNVARPYEVFGTVPLKFEGDSSFPSMHSSLVVSALPFILKESSKKLRLLLIFVVLIPLSRVLIGVHRVSEIIIGGYLGFVISSGFIVLQHRFHIIQKTVRECGRSLEFRRQIVHLLVGVSLGLLLYFEILSLFAATIIMFGGIALSLASRSIRVPLIHHVLRAFEREKTLWNMPGIGVILLFLGIILSFTFFPPRIALIASLITAIGDAIAPILGMYLGRIPLWWNKKKHLEGLLCSIGLTTLVLWSFFPFVPLFWATSVSMFLESLPRRRDVQYIDDNLVVPLSASIVLQVAENLLQ